MFYNLRSLQEVVLLAVDETVKTSAELSAVSNESFIHISPKLGIRGHGVFIYLPVHMYLTVSVSW